MFYGLSRYYCNKYATNMWCGFSNYSFKIPLCLALVRSKYFSQCKATSGIFFLSKYQNPLYPSIAGPFFSFSVFYNMTLKSSVFQNCLINAYLPSTRWLSLFHKIPLFLSRLFCLRLLSLKCLFPFLQSSPSAINILYHTKEDFTILKVLCFY